MSGMDYEYLGQCLYDVSDTNEPVECGEPAIVAVWWDAVSPKLVLCKKHFDLVRAQEALEECGDSTDSVTRKGDEMKAVVTCPECGEKHYYIGTVEGFRLPPECQKCGYGFPDQEIFEDQPKEK